SGEYGFEVFFRFCSITGNPPRVLPSGKPGAVQGGSPRQVFELAFKSLQIAQQTGKYGLVAEAMGPWLKERWTFIWERQRFLLSRPALHEVSILDAMKDDEASNESKVVNILMAVLPTLGIGNQREIEGILAALPR
ncbi:hypothetical protein, partial [Roseibaca sp. Y0-43]|uniref:hypothetical protein n=1 Tax=Roseibaca sp. Y0-43 TaxID=2816854 RepID=UPI001D0C456A